MSRQHEKEKRLTRSTVFEHRRKSLIASEAIYVYIWSRQKLIKHSKNSHFGEFLKNLCCQTALPDRSIWTGQIIGWKCQNCHFQNSKKPLWILKSKFKRDIFAIFNNVQKKGMCSKVVFAMWKMKLFYVSTNLQKHAVEHVGHGTRPLLIKRKQCWQAGVATVSSPAVLK